MTNSSAMEAAVVVVATIGVWFVSKKPFIGHFTILFTVHVIRSPVALRRYVVRAVIPCGSCP